ncbi:hypothetical protein [Neobacillus soli]|uniref:hypothetical protein n=1 Tax=Neobacillus soli TaxID=220688 RepID=UPI001155780E|nr:hypothetical protein [Neobacillus soli]
MVRLVDEVEVYRKFGGYLPAACARPKISSLKHGGNFVHKEKKMRILSVIFQKGIDRYLTKKTEIRGQVRPQKHLAPYIREEI